MSTHIDIKKSHAKVINMHAQKIKFQMNITILHKDRITNVDIDIWFVATINLFVYIFK